MASEAMRPIELTLIVAATARNMGIGRAGDLPWTGLRNEMAYFARVTKRADDAPNQVASHVFKSIQKLLTQDLHSLKPLINAVIMGRKTWDSIPPTFRPLKGRMNIVLSRSHTNTEALPLTNTDEEPLRLASLSDAIEVLQRSDEIGKVFVIGGAEIYRAALLEKATKRILLTRISSEFDCDTFFPVTLNEGDGHWKKQSKEELDSWVGETLACEQEENGVKYVYEIYERD